MKPAIKNCNHNNKHRKRLTNFLSSQKPLFDISRIRHLTFDPKLTPPLTLVNVGLKCEKKLINYSGGLQLASQFNHCSLSCLNSVRFSLPNVRGENEGDYPW